MEKPAKPLKTPVGFDIRPEVWLPRRISRGAEPYAWRFNVSHPSYPKHRLYRRVKSASFHALTPQAIMSLAVEKFLGRQELYDIHAPIDEKAMDEYVAKDPRRRSGVMIRRWRREWDEKGFYQDYYDEVDARTQRKLLKTAIELAHHLGRDCRVRRRQRLPPQLAPQSARENVKR